MCSSWVGRLQVFFLFIMASDTKRNTSAGNKRNHKNGVSRRWQRPRSNSYRQEGENTNRRDFRRDSGLWRPSTQQQLPRRMIFNGRNASPRHSSSGGRGVFTRMNPRPMAVGAGPPINSMQPFRPPLPLNSNLRYVGHQFYDASSVYNRDPQMQPHRFLNHQFNIHPQNQASFISESIPANHVKFPSPHVSINQRCTSAVSSMGHQNHLHGYEGGFSSEYNPRRLPYNRNWGRPRGSAGGLSSESSLRRISMTPRYHRGAGAVKRTGVSRRGTFRGRRRGRGGGQFPRSSFYVHPSPASATAPKRHLRWRNNYRDLQRDIQLYIRLTSRDPLGLDDICRENRRRDNLGLTPLRGDSAMNTPAYSLSTPIPHREIEVSSLTPMNTGRNEATPQHAGSSGGNGLGSQSQERDLLLESPIPQPAFNADAYQLPGSDVIDRQRSDLSDTSGTDRVRYESSQDREEPSNAENPQDLNQSLESVEQQPEEEASVAQNLRVSNDSFHQRHRNHVYSNPHGRSRFLEHTVYGNYHNYYTRRRVHLSESLFRPYIESRRCLDIGCNSGVITIALAKMLPETILGIDIDGRLIQEAQRTLVRERRAERMRRMGDINSRQDDLDDYLSNVDFQTADYIPDEDRSFEPQYDTILALSVTKWIHLVHGDRGLLRFFRRVYSELQEGGFFLIEPQPLRSYRKSYLKDYHKDPRCELHKTPPFLDDLHAVGFSYVCALQDGRPDAGFRHRTIYVLRKQAPEAVSTSQLNEGYPRPPSCRYYPSPYHRRLFSGQPSTSWNVPMTPNPASPSGSYLNEAPGTSHSFGAFDLHRYSPFAYDAVDSSSSETSPSRLVPGTSAAGRVDAASEGLRSPSPSPGPRPDSPSTEASDATEGVFHSDPEADADGSPDAEYWRSAEPGDASSSRMAPREPDDTDGQPARAAPPPGYAMPLNFVFRPSSRQSSMEEGTSGAPSEASTSASQSASAPNACHQPIKMRLRRLHHGHPNGSDRWTVDDGTLDDELSDEDEDSDTDIDISGDEMMYHGEDDEEDEELSQEEEEEEEEENVCDDVNDSHGRSVRETNCCPLAYHQTSGEDSSESGSRSRFWPESESASTSRSRSRLESHSGSESDLSQGLST